MTEAYLFDLGRNAFLVTLALSTPVLGLGMVVGLLVSVFQAVTSIQEMTLTFVPKILAVMVALAIFGPWMLTVIIRFTYDIIVSIPVLVK